MTKNGTNLPKQEISQASNIIGVASIIGLTVCFVFALTEEANIPLFLYAIFGGGILGTDNIIKMLRTIFRLDK